MEKIIKVQYEFHVQYEHEEHYQYLLKELRKAPIINMCGAGNASDNIIHSYGCKIIGNGEIINT